MSKNTCGYVPQPAQRRSKKAHRREGGTLVQQLHGTIWQTFATNTLTLATRQQSEMPLLSGARVTQGTGGADGMLQTKLMAVPRAVLVSLALSLSLDKAVAPSQSQINDIPQQNEENPASGK